MILLSTSSCKHSGRTYLELKIEGITEKLINHQWHLSIDRPVDPHHLYPYLELVRQSL
jgi:hypothetical protein